MPRKYEVGFTGARIYGFGVLRCELVSVVQGAALKVTLGLGQWGLGAA